MENREFLLKNNSFLIKNQHFSNFWSTEQFPDCSLVVEGRKIECHKIVLSRASSYLENLFKVYDVNPHPLMMLFDMTYDAVYTIVEFMYTGEVRVSQNLLMDVLKAGMTLEIKGFDYDIINHLISPPQQSPIHPPALSNVQLALLIQKCDAVLARTRIAETYEDNIAANDSITSNDSNRVVSTAGLPHSKRRRTEETLPLSPPVSSGSSPPSQNMEIAKQEHAEGTNDAEFQIDASAPIASTSYHAHVSNTTVPNGRLKVAESSLAPQRTNVRKNINIATTNIRVHKYTDEQMKSAVEDVLGRRRTPIEAINCYNVPRRTFFRRLKKERQKRGIPSIRKKAKQTYSASPTSINQPNNDLTTHLKIALDTINQERNIQLANHFKSLVEQLQSQNEGVNNESRQSEDSIISSERSLGENNGRFDK